MKTVFKSLPALIICALFVFAACAGDTYDNAVLNISVNNNSARSAALAVSVEEIDHQIILTGPTGMVLTYNLTGNGNLSASVAAGTWRIDVTGYYGEELYSQGTASVAVKAGQSNSVSVLMNVVWQDGGFIPPPGSNLPQLPGNAYIDGDNWFVTGTPNKLYAYYYDPAWDSNDPNVAVSPMDGYIVQWYVGGRLVQTDTDAYIIPPTSPTTPYSELQGPSFDVIEEDWNRDVFAIISHPDYYGVKSNNLRICMEIRNTDWNDFINQWGIWGSGWGENSYILTDSIYSGTVSPPQTPFNGYLDANGRSVNSDLSITGDYAGLFPHIGPRGTVMNMKRTNFISHSPSGDCYVGAVAGLNEGTIMNIAYDDLSSGSITAGGSGGNNYAGGIAGHNKGIIKNCYVNIDGPPPIILASGLSSYAGGIAGVNEGEISFCWVNTHTADPIRGGNGAGGIAGKNSKAINNCIVLEGLIYQTNGTNGAGRIWGTGNGTGRGNYANNDPIQLELSHNPGTPTPFLVDYTDDRTDSKHGKGVPYDTSLLPIYSPDDAASENWWMYIAGWNAVWYPAPNVLVTSWAVSPERPWWWGGTPPYYYPELPF